MANKKQILSDLVAVRNTIKNKFRKSYMERKLQERSIKEIMKPVLSSINDHKKKNPLKKLSHVELTSIQLDPKTTPKNQQEPSNYESGGAPTVVRRSLIPQFQKANVEKNKSVDDDYGGYTLNITPVDKKKNKN